MQVCIPVETMYVGIGWNELDGEQKHTDLLDGFISGNIVKEANPGGVLS